MGMIAGSIEPPLNLILIVGGDTLADAIGTETYLPALLAIGDAQKRYFQSTGKRATRMYLTTNDMFALAECLAFETLRWCLDYSGWFPEGLPPVLRGLEIIRLAEEDYGA